MPIFKKTSIFPFAKTNAQDSDKITLKKAIKEQQKSKQLNPGWFLPLAISLMVLGLVWIVVFYLTASSSFSGFPIPGIGNWNLAIGLVLILIGFVMLAFWK
jgi:hypothetical protein